MGIGVLTIFDGIGFWPLIQKTVSDIHKTLTTVVVEDSYAQQVVISKLVEIHPNLELADVFHNGIKALDYLRKNSVDLILLDIEMPVLDGFEFLDSLNDPPSIIVVSNKSDYALKAFDYNVTDYLQKPVEKSRFNAAIKRVLKAHRRLQSISEDDDFIYVNSGIHKKKVPFRNIEWIEALGDYVKIVTVNGNFLVSSTMKAFLGKLPKDQFVRIHKSYIVNITKVKNWSSTSVEIRGTEIPMSRAKKDDLEKLLIGI